MRGPERWAALSLCAAMLAAGRGSRAADGGSPALPPGHPPIEDAADDAGQSPVPKDTTAIDPSLPPGAVLVEIRDGRGRPVPRVPVVVADSRRHATRFTDDAGNARFLDLPTGSTLSYRVSAAFGGPTAIYAAPPFQLDRTNGQRVRIHVYPVTSDIDTTVVGVQGMVYIERKDDVLEVSELYQIYNMGQSSWAPTEAVLDLPTGAKVLSSEAGTDDARFEPTQNGVKLVGLFSPGQHDVALRFQIPYEPGETFETTLDLPPHIARMRVVAEADRDMRLSVEGFAAASADRNQRGQRVLVADRQVRAGERPIDRVRLTLENLPGPGSGRYWALMLASATLVAGLYLALAHRSDPERWATTEETEQARIRLVDALDALDEARDVGDVGPKTYARQRQILLDALARLLAGKAL